MKRRSFLKGAALVAAGAAASPLVKACGPRQANADLSVAGNFSYGPDGKFTLLQFTDTHYIAGDPRSVRALKCVQDALEGVKPDLVVHTGDILFGKPDIQSAMEILQPLAVSGIPWAVALGNHDSQFGSSREDMFKAIRALPGCINLPPKDGVYGCSNDVITLSGNSLEHVFYLFDSMDAVVLKGEEEIHCYDYIRHSQIAWYRDHSRHFTAKAGHPVPSMALFHIPLCEIQEGLAAGTLLAGNNGEPPCPSRLNSGLLAQFREMGDVQAIVTGHDHDCDYVLDYGCMYYIYGRYSGCDTVYNHLGLSGCRVFEFTRGEPGFRTWVRLYGGEIQQPLALSRS